MSANNGSRERVSRRVWSTVTKDFKELNHETEGKQVTGVWIAFCCRKRDREPFLAVLKY